ncbi:MAG: FG-GAP repeat domain-containing protein [Planctomycetota bacterium]|jgi:hypothetical protein
MTVPFLAAAYALALLAGPAVAQLAPPSVPHDVRWQHAPDPGPHALAYVDSSTGLEEPFLDGGRTELEFGDVNGDVHPDLVSIGDHGSPFINTPQHGLMVWFGDGRGNWVVQQTGDFGYGGVALGDVNGDGLMDAGYGMHHDYSATDLGDQLLEVALGDGSGTAWLPWDDGLATSGETWGMFGTDFGHVDGDGDLDVVSNSFGCCAGVHVYLNHGDGTWSQSWGFLGGNSSMDALFADVDGNGHLDVCAANQAGRVWRGDGTGNFFAAEGNLPAAYSGLAAGDVDGDGRDEYGIVSGGAPTVWSWGPGNVWTPRNEGLPTSGSVQGMQLCDMDGDGHRDVLAFGKGTLSVWRGDGGGRLDACLERHDAGRHGQGLEGAADGDRRRPQRLPGPRARAGGDLRPVQRPQRALRVPRGLRAGGARGAPHRTRARPRVACGPGALRGLDRGGPGPDARRRRGQRARPALRLRRHGAVDDARRRRAEQRPLATRRAAGPRRFRLLAAPRAHHAGRPGRHEARALHDPALKETRGRTIPQRVVRGPRIVTQCGTN